VLARDTPPRVLDDKAKARFDRSDARIEERAKTLVELTQAAEFPLHRWPAHADEAARKPDARSAQRYRKMLPSLESHGLDRKALEAARGPSQMRKG